MFANLLQLVSRRATPEYEREFVQEVRIRHLSRNRRMERFFVLGWTVIAIKCCLVWWLCSHYRMPFSPLWVIVPTVLFASLATAVYYWRD